MPDSNLRVIKLGIDDSKLDAINDHLLALDRAWWYEPGIPTRPWYQNLFAATDETSGYGAWMLPALRWAVEYREPDALEHALDLYDEVFARMTAELASIEDQVGG